jgi:uncharacterized repeat protein (TIGR01451 family)
LVLTVLDVPQARGQDLGVTMLRSDTDPRGVIVPGGTVTISIGVNNLRGDAEAHASVLTVTLPDGLKLQQARPAPNRIEPGKGSANLNWSLGTVAARASSRIFELDLTTAADVQADTKLIVLATVTTSDNDANQKNNTAAFILLVQPAVADLAVKSSLVAVPFTLGKPVRFTAEVSNFGTAVASRSVFTLMLPPKISFESSDPPPTGTSDSSVTWQLGDIEPAGSRSVAVTIALDIGLGANAGDSTPESRLRFKLDASTTTTDVNPANNHLEIDKHVQLAGFDIQVWLAVQGADEPGELSVGKDATYTITYGNFGNAPASKASVLLSLWEGLNFVSAEPAPARSSKSDKFRGGVLEWDAGDLPVGESRLISCRVHVASVPDDGALVMATISAPGTDINPTNNVAYSNGYAPRASKRQAARSGRALWPWLLVLALVAGLLVVLRALWRRRHASAA